MADVRAQTLDAFDPGVDGNVYAIAVQPDNRILIGGSFSNIGGGGSGSTSRLRLARLHPDGSVDASFDPQAILVGGGGGDGVRAIAVLPDGKILVGGAGTFAGGRYIVRLNSNGSLDPTFTTTANISVLAIVLQPDGKVLVGGSFTTLGGVPRNRIGRLHADGTLDASFDPGASNSVYALALQPDGQILVGGLFGAIGGGGSGATLRAGIARLNSSGVVDPAFNPGLAYSQTPTVRAIAIQPDGRILIGGAFSSVAGTVRHDIARLSVSGALDITFVPPVGTVSSFYSVNSIVALPNRKVLLGGMFSLAPAARSHLARLNSTGSTDTTFQGDTNAPVHVVAVDLAGRLTVGGEFGTIAGSARSRLARLDLSTRLLAQLVGPGSGPIFDAWSVALSGDGNTAMVSDPNDNNSRGGVWVWVRDQFGGWEEEEKLNPGFLSYPSAMPLGLSADGHTAIIAAGSSPFLEASIWFRSARWQQVATLSPSDETAESSNQISAALSADGNTGIIGARRDNSSQGAAWIFARNAVGAWVQQGPKLVGASSQFSAQGSGVALSADGNTAIVAGDGPAGGVFVWTRNAGVWTQQGQKLLPNAAVASVSVSADGNTLVAGIPNDNNGVGAAWVLIRNGGSWTAQQKLVAADAVTGQFEAPLQGGAVALSADGNTALIGGEGDDRYKGAAWIWSRKGSVWTQEPKLAGPGINGHFGQSVDISGADGTVIIADLFFPYSPPWVSSRPNAVTFAASNVTRDSATLFASFYSNGTFTTGLLEFGLSTTYGWSFWLNEEGQGWKSMWADSQSWGWRFQPVTVTKVLSGLACGTTYHFRAVASAGNTNTYTPDRTFTTAACGPAVVTLPASSIGATSATLNATVNPEGVATTLHFDYGPSVGYGASVLAGDVGSGTTPVSGSFALNGLSCGATYHYRARAQNSGGTGNGADQTFTTAPCAPTIATIMPGDARITVAFVAGADGGVPITNYQYSLDGGATWVTRSPASTASPLVILNLGNGTSYFVRLRAINAVGDGVPSATVAATPRTTAAAPTITVTPGNGQLTVAFTPGADGGAAITNYESSTNAGATWTSRSPAGTTSPLLIGGLINGTSYQVHLRATNAAGPGAASATVAATPWTTPGAPLITGVEPGNSQVIVVFAAAGDGGRPITSYSYSTDGGATWIPRSPASPASPLVITGLVNGTTYQVQLRAVNDNGNGAASAPASATPGLSTDESVDAFDPNVDGDVLAIAVQPDQRILVGGAFTTVGVGPGAVARQKIARFLPDGSLDPTFDPHDNIAADSTVTAIAVQPDGHILIATDAPPTRRHIGRLRADGSLDTSFDYAAANDRVLAIAVQPDPVGGTFKILVGGAFTTIGRLGQETGRSRIGRFNADGTVDSFNPGADGTVHALAVDPVGRILVGGSFASLGGGARHNIGRIGNDGSLDPNFNPGATGGTDSIVRALALLPDGDIVVAGRFTTLAGATRHNVGRLEANGAPDTGFDPGSRSRMPSGTVPADVLDAAAIVETVVALPDGKIVVGGFAAAVPHDDLAPRHLARVNRDGSLETHFEPRANGRVSALVRQPDGKILVGGQFTTIGGSLRNRVARLGAPTSFAPGPVPAPFTDDPVVARVTVLEAAHILELRVRIDALRARFALVPTTWTDPTLPGGPVRTVHIQQLRDALVAAYDKALQAGASAPRPVFADNPLMPGTTIRGLHIEQLRAAVRLLEASF